MVEDPISQENRRRLYDAIVALPGLSFREAQRIAGTAPGETADHLQRLEEAGHVLRERGIDQEFFFARAVPPASNDVLRQSHSDTVRRVLVALLEQPGLTPDALARRLGVPAPQISIHLRELARSGLASAAGRDGRGGYAVADRIAVGQLLVRFRYGRLDRMVDRCVGLWAEVFPP